MCPLAKSTFVILNLTWLSFMRRSYPDDPILKYRILKDFTPSERANRCTGDSAFSLAVFLVFLTGTPLTALAQGQGSWGGGTGIAALILGVIGFAFLLWASFVFSIVKGFITKKGTRLVVTVFLACLPLAFCQLNFMRLDYNYKKRSDLRTSLRIKAEDYLAIKCQTDRKLSKLIVIDAGSGIFIDGAGEPPKINGVPQRPNWQEIEKIQNANSVSGKPAMNYTAQFLTPVGWTSQRYISHELFAVGIPFAEHSKSGNFRRTASFDWWKTNTPANVLGPLLKPYDGGIHLRPNSSLEFAVEALQSQYTLEFKDISTREDRDNWVARGSMRLIHRGDNRLIAEYIGLAASQFPTLEGDSSDSWEKITVCPGSESKYIQADRWQPINFFFNELAQLKSTE